MAKATRNVRLGHVDAVFTSRPDGTLLVQPTGELGPYAIRLTDRLVHWAETTPEAIFLAKRDKARGGDWRTLTYAETLGLVRSLGQAMLDRGLSAERPLMILSGNDLEHALMGLAAMHVGVPFAPISPAYSLVSSDHSKLRHIAGLLTPGLVFAADGARFAPAIAAALPPDTEIVFTTPPGPAALPGRRVTLFADLAATPATPAVEAALAAVGPDTIGKILFTSGSTGLPKGVINTQRMLCSNQRMIQVAFPFLMDAPPVLVDWLPWNHTFGGNHNLGLVIYNGGSLYIDEGKPVPQGIAETVRNLREIAPTLYFNVPRGFEEIAKYLRAEPALAAKLFSKLKLFFYSGASLPQHVWDALDEIGIATCGESIAMLTGLGSTETAPFALVCRPDVTGSGIVGLPVAGVELKLAPDGDKMEARVRGPNITPGYWRQPQQTASAFDEEGFYKFGDALAFVDPEKPELGFRFDGRVSEDFKLATGTWVSVGPLRARLIAGLAPFVTDVVIAGADRNYLAVFGVPDLDLCRAACPDLPPGAPAAEMLRHPALQRALGDRLAALARSSTGSSTRVARLMLLIDPLSLDVGEVTDKGSVNQRAVLTHRKPLVEELYADPAAPHIICIEETVA